MKKATFAAGCFWGVEEKFRHVEGVNNTRVGYTGGHVDLSTVKQPYKLVCTDTTGHAEAVELTYDPEVINYEELVDIFFKLHDPTQKNRQGWDIGKQYRSAIFYHDEEQKRIANEKKDALNEKKRFKKVVTEIVGASTFYPAEEYHQQYYEKRGTAGCLTHIKL